MKFLAGAITGGVGSVIGNPFDVLKVRKNYFVSNDKHVVMVSWKDAKSEENLHQINFVSNVFEGNGNHSRIFKKNIVRLDKNSLDPCPNQQRR